MSKALKVVIALTLIISITGFLGWLTPVKDFLAWMTSPIFKSVRTVTIKVSDNISTVISIGNVAKENARLQEKIALIEAENATLRESLAEQGELRSALELKERTGYDLIGSRIISTDPTRLNQVLIIDRGQDSGLLKGQPVVDSLGNFIGQLTAVFEKTAEVTLISDSNSRLPALVSETGAKGHIQGQHALSVALVDVPQGQDLPSGAHVVTTGLVPGIPPGLLIGTISDISSRGGDLFQVANINTAADLRGMRLLFIIRGVK